MRSVKSEVTVRPGTAAHVVGWWKIGAWRIGGDPGPPELGRVRSTVLFELGSWWADGRLFTGWRR